jgi:hypothetical protein
VVWKGKRGGAGGGTRLWQDGRGSWVGERVDGFGIEDERSGSAGNAKDGADVEGNEVEGGGSRRLRY